MRQLETKQTGKNLESTRVYRRCRLTIAEHCKLIRCKLAVLVQYLFPFRPDDIHIQIGKTRIKVRFIKSPYSESQRRALAIATAQYLVRGLTTGTLPEVECELKRLTSFTAPSEARHRI